MKAIISRDDESFQDSSEITLIDLVFQMKMATFRFQTLSGELVLIGSDYIRLLLDR